MKRIVIPICLTVFISFPVLYGQELTLPYDRIERSSPDLLGNFLSDHLQYLNSVSPDHLKVSKPLLRWEWYHAPRIDAGGTAPGTGEYLEIVRNINEAKKHGKTFSSASWIPVGPLELVPHPGQVSIHDIGRVNCIAFHPADPDIIWIGAPQGGVWKTLNGGETWIPVGDDLPLMKVSDIAVDPQDPDVMYICLGDYGYMGFYVYYLARPTAYGLGVYKTTDGGNTWEPTSLTFELEDGFQSLMRRVFINPQNTNELLAAGVSGIYKSADAGLTWNKIQDCMVWDIESQPGDGNTHYISTCDWLGGECGVMKSLDFGASFQELATGIPKYNTVTRIEVAVAPSDENYVYATTVGYDDAFYAFYRSTDAGQTWEKRSDSSQFNLFGQMNGDPSNKLAQASYDLWLTVDPADRDRVFSGAMNIWGSHDGGLTWNISSFGINYYGESIHFDHHCIARNPLDSKFYLGCDGGLFSTDSLILGNLAQFDSCLQAGSTSQNCYEFGMEFENLSAGLVITEFYRLALSGGNTGYVLAGSQDNCVFFKKEDGSWLNVTLGDGMECMVHPTDPDILYASNQFGYLFRSVNGGLTMSSYPVTGPIISQEGTGVWITPFAMNQNDPDILYAGFRNVWKSTAGGSGWTKISSFANMPGYGQPKPIWDLALAPTDPDILYVAKQPYPAAGIGLSAELWKTTDGGLNWVHITNGLPVQNNYINDIAITENPEVVYVVCTGWQDGKKVYKTTDEGQSWTNISGSLPNIPVSAIAYQLYSQKHDVYIGTDLGVYFINDDYSDWQLFNDNLPNVCICELEINYVENRIYAATYGRGLWMADLLNPVTGTGEDNRLQQADISISPNPSAGIASLEVGNMVPGTAQLRLDILNVQGRVVHTENIPGLHISCRVQLNLSHLPAGLYYVRVSAGAFSRTGKLMVKK